MLKGNWHEARRCWQRWRCLCHHNPTVSPESKAIISTRRCVGEWLTRDKDTALKCQCKSRRTGTVFLKGSIFSQSDAHLFWHITESVSHVHALLSSSIENYDAYSEESHLTDLSRTLQRFSLNTNSLWRKIRKNPYRFQQVWFALFLYLIMDKGRLWTMFISRGWHWVVLVQSVKVERTGLFKHGGRISFLYISCQTKIESLPHIFQSLQWMR